MWMTTHDIMRKSDITVDVENKVPFNCSYLSPFLSNLCKNVKGFFAFLNKTSVTCLALLFHLL